MQSLTAQTTHPIVLEIFATLRRHVNFQIPASARQERELQIVMQVEALLDEALPWQRGHGRRTAALAEHLGLAAGFSRETLHHLTLASLLHDIGLLALPTRLTAHSGYLALQSYASVQCHPRLASQWLESVPFLERASVIIAHHHERWDGSGYPYGIRGLFIPIEARVLAIADAFDSLDVPDVNDQGLHDQVAYRIIRAAAGTQFDPQLVNLLCNGLGQLKIQNRHPRLAIVACGDTEGRSAEKCQNIDEDS